MRLVSRKLSPLLKVIALLNILTLLLPPSFISTAFSQPVSDQPLLNLPSPGTMVNRSTGYQPPSLRAIRLHPENALKLDFLIDHGDDKNLEGQALQDETQKLVKYFLAALATPESELWVNLNPYEKDKITTEQLGFTEMGRDLLGQDYVLKQLTASLIYPEKDLGKAFWTKVRQKAYELFGKTDIPINTFNKVWIVPDKAVVYEKGDTAFVVESRLKVLLEEDYLALMNNISNEKFGTDLLKADEVKQLNNVSSAIVKEVILPEIEKEVNEGKNFAQLRQVYSSLVLAAWYKNNLKQGLLSKAYVDRGRIAGVDLDDKTMKDKIHERYMEAYRRGVYDYIKEDFDPVAKANVERNYFSGGFDGGEIVQIQAAQGRKYDTMNATQRSETESQFRNVVAGRQLTWSVENMQPTQVAKSTNITINSKPTQLTTTGVVRGIAEIDLTKYQGQLDKVVQTRGMGNLTVNQVNVRGDLDTAQVVAVVGERGTIARLETGPEVSERAAVSYVDRAGRPMPEIREIHTQELAVGEERIPVALGQGQAAPTPGQMENLGKTMTNLVGTKMAERPDIVVIGLNSENTDVENRLDSTGLKIAVVSPRLLDQTRAPEAVAVDHWRGGEVHGQDFSERVTLASGKEVVAQSSVPISAGDLQDNLRQVPGLPENVTGVRVQPNFEGHEIFVNPERVLLVPKALAEKMSPQQAQTFSVAQVNETGQRQQPKTAAYSFTINNTPVTYQGPELSSTQRTQVEQKMGVVLKSPEIKLAAANGVPINFVAGAPEALAANQFLHGAKDNGVVEVLFNSGEIVRPVTNIGEFEQNVRISPVVQQDTRQFTAIGALRLAGHDGVNVMAASSVAQQIDLTKYQGQLDKVVQTRGMGNLTVNQVNVRGDLDTAQVVAVVGERGTIARLETGPEVSERAAVSYVDRAGRPMPEIREIHTQELAVGEERIPVALGQGQAAPTPGQMENLGKTMTNLVGTKMAERPDIVVIGLNSENTDVENRLDSTGLKIAVVSPRLLDQTRAPEAVAVDHWRGGEVHGQDFSERVTLASGREVTVVSPIPINREQVQQNLRQVNLPESTRSVRIQPNYEGPEVYTGVSESRIPVTFNKGQVNLQEIRMVSVNETGERQQPRTETYSFTINNTPVTYQGPQMTDQERTAFSTHFGEVMERFSPGAREFRVQGDNSYRDLQTFSRTRGDITQVALNPRGFTSNNFDNVKSELKIHRGNERTQSITLEGKNPAGINLNPKFLKLDVTGEGLSEMAFQNIPDIEMDGLIPVIESLIPVKDVSEILGAGADGKSRASSMAASSH